MIEYYQLYLSFNNLLTYENVNNIKYDYIIRLRTDVIYTKQLNFDFLNITNEDILNKLQNISMITNNIIFNSIENITLFFNNLLLLNNGIILNKLNCENNDMFINDKYLYKIINNEYLSNKDLNKLIDFINYYIKKGDFILTFRKNLFFLIKRDLFLKIKDLGINYGLYKDIDNEWWFNSESQLQIICRYNNISIFDMTPKISGLSLYNYNKNNYFDKDNNLINNPENIFFICRN